MTIDYTTVSLVSAIKRRGFIPAGSGTSGDDILAYATDELDVYIPSFLKGIREEYLVASLDLPVTAGVVPAPARAVGAALRTIGWLNSDGTVRFIDRIEPERAGLLAGRVGEPSFYAFQGNNLLLLPAPTSGTLRLTYQRRPGRLVFPSECCQVNGAATKSSDPIYFGGARPQSFGASDAEANTKAYDWLHPTPNFDPFAVDANSAGTYSWLASPLSVLASPFPTGVALGDYLSLAGETCIPQLPPECFPLLAQATALAIANATGSARVDVIHKKFDMVEAEVRSLLSPRTTGSSRPIVSKSRIGLGRW